MGRVGKVMYPCIFLDSRNLQGYITFQFSFQKQIWKVIYPCIFQTTFFGWKQSYHSKNYVSLYFPCIHIEGKKNTRIHNISGNTFLGQIWKVMNPCIFLQNILHSWKIQGYITFQITGPKFWFWNVTYPCIFLAHI